MCKKEKLNIIPPFDKFYQTLAVVFSKLTEVLNLVSL